MNIKRYIFESAFQRKLFYRKCYVAYGSVLFYILFVQMIDIFYCCTKIIF